jgi:hypothetical protein
MELILRDTESKIIIIVFVAADNFISYVTCILIYSNYSRERVAENKFVFGGHHLSSERLNGVYIVPGSLYYPSIITMSNLGVNA